MNPLSNHSDAALYPYTQAGEGQLRRELAEINGERPTPTGGKGLMPDVPGNAAYWEARNNEQEGGRS